MKVVDFTEKKAEKNNIITPKALIEHLLSAINSGEIDSVVYVAKSRDGQLDVGCNNMIQTESIGMLECGKQIIMNDMYDD